MVPGVEMYKCTNAQSCICAKDEYESVLAACRVTTMSAALWLEKALHRFQEKGEGESD